ncbi:protein of unknown function [Paraburkholderia kururiensis]
MTYDSPGGAVTDVSCGKAALRGRHGGRTSSGPVRTGEARRDSVTHVNPASGEDRHFSVFCPKNGHFARCRRYNSAST